MEDDDERPFVLRARKARGDHARARPQQVRPAPASNAPAKSIHVACSKRKECAPWLHGPTGASPRSSRCSLSSEARVPGAPRAAVAGHRRAVHHHREARQLHPSLRRAPRAFPHTMHGLHAHSKGLQVLVLARVHPRRRERRPLLLHRRRCVLRPCTTVNADARAQDPFKVVRTGPGLDAQGDPMAVLQKELAVYKYIKIPEIPTFTGASATSLVTRAAALSNSRACRRRNRLRLLRLCALL